MLQDSIKTLSLHGFKSIQALENFDLHALNVFIGANGVGKSNFISFFRMVKEIVERHFQRWAARQGGTNRILTYGVKETTQLQFKIEFIASKLDAYEVKLESITGDTLVFSLEQLYAKSGQYSYRGTSQESYVHNQYGDRQFDVCMDICYSLVSQWSIFHFHDTSATASVKRLGSLHDNQYLRADAANLAAFLHRIRTESLEAYQQIRKTIQLALPFFDDFVLQPQALPSGEKQIRLLWQQTDSDYPLWPSQLSDGSIRFICLVTALLQPKPPSTIIIDEPELGLHPCAISLLGALLRSASTRMQVIVSTQSVALLNEFSIDDLVVVEREQGVSTFKRLQADAFSEWLQEYSLGELWCKNVLGGRP